MDAPEYLDHIDEQLRAYEFQLVDNELIPETMRVYSRQTDRLGPAGVHHEIVIVDNIDDHNVDAIEAKFTGVRNVYDGIRTASPSRLDSERVYHLIVAEEVTKPMQIRAERAAGEILDNDAFLLPILVDLSESHLLYDEPSSLRRVSTHGRMASNVEKYFRL